MIPYIISDDSLVVMVKGKTYTLTQSSHVNYSKIRDALKRQDFKVIPGLLDVTKTINRLGRGKVTVVNGQVFFNGETIHNSLTKRIISMLTEGFNIKPMVAFLENLMQNPSKRAVDELYGFLEKNSLPLTEDGYFLAYKKVRDDYKDIYTGQMDNSVGSLVEMERNKVDDNKERTCSKGLHFCSLSYLKEYSSAPGNGTRVVVVKIHPADVVSIPVDYNNAKGRACRYLIVEDITNEMVTQDSEYFNRSVYPSYNEVSENAHHVDADDNVYNEDGYDPDGYDRDGYDQDGYDVDGYDRDGYDINGYDRDGYDGEGYDEDGYDRDGYDVNGYDDDGYDEEGYDEFGYNREGFDRNGLDEQGFDVDGWDSEGYDESGYDQDGYDREGYDEDGYDRNGYDQDGYDVDGYDKDGYDIDGYNAQGFDIEGYDEEGYNSSGLDRFGMKKDGTPGYRMPPRPGPTIVS